MATPKLTPQTKQKIDSMSYAQLLYEWRFASLGNDMFQGETGAYFQEKMAERKKAFTDAELVQISKYIGWKK